VYCLENLPPCNSSAYCSLVRIASTAESLRRDAPMNREEDLSMLSYPTLTARRTRLTWGVLPLALLVAFLLAACGGTGTTTNTTPTATTQPTTAPAATTQPTTAPAATTPTSASSGSVVTVKIVENNGVYSFKPAKISIKAGTEVKWLNTSDAPHIVASDTTGAFTASSTLTQNQAYTHTFSSAGSFPYHCSIHPYMKATVTVMS
jgi:plastocyanin